MVQNGSFYFLQRHRDNKFQWLHDADFPRYIFFSEASQAPASFLSIHEPFPEAAPKAARHSEGNSRPIFCQIDDRQLKVLFSKEYPFCQFFFSDSQRYGLPCNRQPPIHSSVPLPYHQSDKIWGRKTVKK